MLETIAAAAVVVVVVVIQVEGKRKVVFVIEVIRLKVIVAITSYVNILYKYILMLPLFDDIIHIHKIQFYSTL